MLGLIVRNGKDDDDSDDVSLVKLSTSAKSENVGIVVDVDVDDDGCIDWGILFSGRKTNMDMKYGVK